MIKRKKIQGCLLFFQTMTIFAAEKEAEKEGIPSCRKAAPLLQRSTTVFTAKQYSAYKEAVLLLEEALILFR